MQIRDATADDVAALGALADEEVDAARLVRDRSVRVAVEDSAVTGFVAYDTWRGAVHVTRLAGDPDAVHELLDAPCEFAVSEAVPVEAVLVEGDALAGVLKDAGFEDVGPGPAFDGEQTRRYRCQSPAE
jgi:hypothetical protein